MQQHVRLIYISFSYSSAWLIECFLTITYIWLVFLWIIEYGSKLFILYALQTGHMARMNLSLLTMAAVVQYSIWISQISIFRLALFEYWNSKFHYRFRLFLGRATWHGQFAFLVGCSTHHWLIELILMLLEYLMATDGFVRNAELWKYFTIYIWIMEWRVRWTDLKEEIVFND